MSREVAQTESMTRQGEIESELQLKCTRQRWMIEEYEKRVRRFVSIYVDTLTTLAIPFPSSSPLLSWGSWGYRNDNVALN